MSEPSRSGDTCTVTLKRRALKTLWIIPTALAALLLVAILGVFLAGAILGRSQAFEEDAWKAGDRRLRWRMAHDPELIPSLVGMTEDALQQRLGDPDNLLVVEDPPPPDKIYLYRLDKPIDPFRWNLEVWIERGRVTKVIIMD
ncbi:MAG: hypothetical protein JSV19_04235 [Phycisphaerales bacterium]|nr:MAG: hypothetical protein JSV19_04235 [Phycisphaerales bacterium]